MKEKNSLDERIYNSTYVQEREKRERGFRVDSKTKQKVVSFVERAPKCEHYYLKPSELNSKICWCKKIDKPCLYLNCPKKKK